MESSFCKDRAPKWRKNVKVGKDAQQNEPMADDVIGFMDGLSFILNCLLKRWRIVPCIMGIPAINVFTYGFDGTVFLCGLYFVGSIHDWSIDANLFLLPTIRNRIGRNKICIDWGFPWTGDIDGILVGPESKRSAVNFSPVLREYLLHLSNCYFSLRQASEWGTCGLQGSFTLFECHLPSNLIKKRDTSNQLCIFTTSGHMWWE